MLACCAISHILHLFELIWCKAGPARVEASICRFTNEPSFLLQSLHSKTLTDCNKIGA